MKPSRTISNGPVSGTKQLKDCVTVLLTCNSTGNEKLPALFIHKYENPRVLKNINKKTLPVDYYWNKKAECKFPSGTNISRNLTIKCDVKIETFFFLLITLQLML